MKWNKSISEIWQGIFCPDSTMAVYKLSSSRITCLENERVRLTHVSQGLGNFAFALWTVTVLLYE